jgi:hypothetical protein
LYCAGAAAAGAQEPARDTARARRDSAAARDTTPAAVPLPAADTADRRARTDTLKAPLARAEMPLGAEIGAGYRWDREALFSSGAQTLADLLERIPGATTFRSGWIAAPSHTGYLGDLSRVRIFYDGVELEPLDPRTGGLLDIGEVQLWTLEELAVERGPDELRVHLRSWRVRRTTPDTRTDVTTGDQDTNLYRGFFGKRSASGYALQLAAQQYGYDNRDDFRGGGDQLAALGRLGWAKGHWSVDAFAIRARRTRDQQTRLLGEGSIPSLRARRVDAYVRGAYGDPERGPWLQLIAASLGFDEETPRGATGPTTTPTPVDTADTTVSRTQYVATGGFTRGAFRLSAAGRTVAQKGESRTTVSGRAGVQGRAVELSLYAEYRTGQGSSLQEVSARLSPTGWLALLGSVGRRHGGPGGAPTILTARLEAGLRLGRLWATGGVLTRDTTAILSPPVVFDPDFVPAADAERATGVFGTLRGRVWRDLYADAFAVRWEGRGFYRPLIQTRAELGVRTSWLSRFPRGNFGFLASVAHEYRGRTWFPSRTTTLDVAPAYHQLIPQLEIRILDGWLFYQQRIHFRATEAQVVPGFVFPRQTSIYGVRWQFWN